MPIISGQNDYIIDKGVLENNSQTTTLTVGRSQNNQDTTYTCVITSIKSIEGVVVNTAVVNLKVFSKYNRQLWLIYNYACIPRINFKNTIGLLGRSSSHKKRIYT